LFTYGKKIHDKIMDVMNPEFQDEEPMNPFDFWSGASFKLKIRKFEGYRNYDKSEFAAPAALSEDDSELESIYEKCYDLNEFIDPENYKSYGELQARLTMVLGEAAPVIQQTIEEPVAPKSAPEPAIASDDDDDTMSYFAKLAGEE